MFVYKQTIDQTKNQLKNKKLHFFFTNKQTNQKQLKKIKGTEKQTTNKKIKQLNKNKKIYKVV